MENASGDLRRALGAHILGRQLFELTRYAVEEFAELDAHNLFELYDLDLEGVKASSSYQQSNTCVDCKDIPAFPEAPYTTPENALMLYRPAV